MKLSKFDPGDKSIFKGFITVCLILIGSLAGGALVSPHTATAGTITTFSSNDTLSPTSMNANFQHIHNLMVGGHGGRLVDADVNTNAGISHAKLAVPALVPKVWAATQTSCASPCTETMVASSGVTSVTHNSVGVWTILFPVRGDVNYAAFVTATNLTFAAPTRICSADGFNTNGFSVHCYNTAAALSDTGFSIVVLDNT